MKPLELKPSSRQVITYTVKKNRLTRLFGGKERTFSLKTPTYWGIRRLKDRTELLTLAEGERPLSKKELSQIVAVATMSDNLRLLPYSVDAFAWYLERKLNEDTLLKLAECVMTLIPAGHYGRPLKLDDILHISQSYFDIKS